MISVISCSASHTNCKNVLGGFGGIEFDPNVSLLWSLSTCEPLSPAKKHKSKITFKKN